MNISRWLATGFLGLAVSLPSFAGKSDDTLNVAFSGEIATLDNYRETGREGLIVARLIYDSLLSRDVASGEFLPELASSYTYVDDKTLDLEIRKNVRFHNGQALTADDVVYTLNLVSSKQYAARYQIAVTWIDKVEKLGDFKVRIRMKAPYPPALEMLAGNLPIYPKSYYEQVGPEGMSTKPVGAGPYRMVEVVPGARYVLERFDGYYKESPKGAPAIKRIVVRTLPEANTQYAELMNGSLDWAWRVPPDEAKNLATRPNIEVKSVPVVRFAYMAFNPSAVPAKTPFPMSGCAARSTMRSTKAPSSRHLWAGRPNPSIPPATRCNSAAKLRFSSTHSTRRKRGNCSRKRIPERLRHRHGGDRNAARPGRSGRLDAGEGRDQGTHQ